MRYLDSKADYPFVKVFGRHPDLVISLINALLPLDENNQVESVEYLTADMVPYNPLRKDTIVDVRCTDKSGRQFLVDIQVIWSREFQYRVQFNDSKAYVRQLGRRRDCILVQPVYSLNFVEEIFEPDTEEYYHYYPLVYDAHSDKLIDGLHLVYIELPKFKLRTFTEKKMNILWLRYLTEIVEETREAPADLLENPEVNKALQMVEMSAFTDAEMLAYEDFWDKVRVENTLITSYEKKGWEEGVKEGIKIVERQILLEIAKNMKAMGISKETIAQATGLSLDEIEQL